MKRLRCSLGRRGSRECLPSGSPHRDGLTGSGREVLQCFRKRDTRDSRRLRKAVLLAAGALLLVAGCGEDEGVANGATATAYVAAPLCAEAKRALSRADGRAGDVRVRAICLPSVESGHRLNLALIGANARRAAEDSNAVGYIGEPTRSATRFSEPILETAGIAQLSQTSGAVAMKKLLEAVAEAGDSGSLRESVNDKLE